MKTSLGENECAKCGLFKTKEGHDACLGTLDIKVVMNACCGHDEIEPYIQFWNSECIRGEPATILQEYLKNGNNIMEVVNKNDVKTTLDVDDLTDSHIIVARIGNEPYVLVGITTGFTFCQFNKFLNPLAQFSGNTSIKATVRRHLELKREVHAFTDWKDAMGWLINNCNDI